MLSSGLVWSFEITNCSKLAGDFFFSLYLSFEQYDATRTEEQQGSCCTFAELEWSYGATGRAAV